MIAYLSINHLGYCMLGLFALAASPAVAATIDTQAALSGVFMQIFNHGITAAALFYFVGLLEQRRGLRGIDDFGGLMQRTPLLCGWMSVAMFSSLGLPGLNGFIGEFLIFKGSFAMAAAFTAIRVIGLLVTAIVFMRAMQSLFSGPLAEGCSAFPRSFAKGKIRRGSRDTAHVRHRRRATIHLQHSSIRPSFKWRGCLAESSAMGKEVIPIERIARAILVIRGEKVLLDS
jgi:NADH:ubiquinone oxidoreductase subunit 4 (subunit M)